MVKNSGDTQARFLAKSLAIFTGRELREWTRIKKSFRRRVALMHADGLGAPIFGEENLPQRRRRGAKGSALEPLNNKERSN